MIATTQVVDAFCQMHQNPTSSSWSGGLRGLSVWNKFAGASYVPVSALARRAALDGELCTNMKLSLARVEYIDLPLLSSPPRPPHLDLPSLQSHNGRRLLHREWFCSSKAGNACSIYVRGRHTPTHVVTDSQIVISGPTNLSH